MVTNKQLLAEVIRAKELQRVTNKLAAMWIEMVDRRLRNPNFKGFTWNRDDLVGSFIGFV